MRPGNYDFAGPEWPMYVDPREPWRPEGRPRPGADPRTRRCPSLRVAKTSPW